PGRGARAGELCPRTRLRHPEQPAFQLRDLLYGRALLRGKDARRIDERNIDVACDMRRRRQLVDGLEQSRAAVHVRRPAETHEQLAGTADTGHEPTETT